MASAVLFSDEARCFSQSEHALYGNSIMRTSHLMKFTDQKKIQKYIFSKTTSAKLTCVQPVILILQIVMLSQVGHR